MKLLIPLFFTLKLFSQDVEIGSWKDYLSYKSASYISETEDKIYCVANGAMFSIEKDNKLVTRISKVSGLSDVNIKKIAYSYTLEVMIIIYENCNVDLIHKNEIYNISDIKRKEITGIKKINNISIKNNTAYLSTSFGLILINLENYEIQDTYTVGEINENIEINGCAFLGDSIIVATSKGLYFANSSNSNLSDYNNWELYTDLNIGYDNVININNDLEIDTSKHIISIAQNNNILIQAFSDSICINNTIYISHEKFERIKYAWVDNQSNIWVADSINGLLKFVDYKYSETYMPDGPKRNEIYSLEFIENKLYNCHGGHINFSQNVQIPDGVSLKNNYDEWTNYDRYQLGNTKDVLEVAVSNGTEYYASWNYGIVEMRNGELITQYNYENTNGALDTTNNTSSGRIRISDLKLDKQRNLWGLSSEVMHPLFVKTINNEWFSFSMNQDRNNLFFDDLIIDKNNQKWGIISRGGGIFVYNDNNTIDNRLDDQYKILNTNLGYGNLPSSWIYSIAEDRDGEIWIGSDKGIAVFYNPGSIFTSNDYDAQQILIQEGNYGQYLLDEDKIKSITIDPGNRKWIGTEKSGVFLLSSDGLDEILHFTSENSPLFSNNIIDIAINEANGEVFIGTQEGIISYRSDATIGNKKQGNTHIFPNPVKSSYNGPIAISGLVENANIKITDIDGNLVFEGFAKGGQAMWLGKTKNGKRVSSGVYLVFSSDVNGKEKLVSKILFIN